MPEKWIIGQPCPYRPEIIHCDDRTRCLRCAWNPEAKLNRKVRIIPTARRRKSKYGSPLRAVLAQICEKELTDQEKNILLLSYGQFLTDREISRRLHYSHSTVSAARRRGEWKICNRLAAASGLPDLTLTEWMDRLHRSRKTFLSDSRCTVYYTVYLRKTGLPIAFGTSVQCAKQMGLTVDGFYCMVSRVAGMMAPKYVVVKEERWNEST